MSIPVPVGLAITGVVIFFVWRISRRKIQRIKQMSPIPPVVPPDGLEVPVVAAFTGLKGLPRQVSGSDNNIKPDPTLFEDRIECRVLSNGSIPLRDLESVDIRDTFATRNLNIYVRGRGDVFTANLLVRSNLAAVPRFPGSRGVLLTQNAEQFMMANPW